MDHSCRRAVVFVVTTRKAWRSLHCRTEAAAAAATAAVAERGRRSGERDIPIGCGGAGPRTDRKIRHEWHDGMTVVGGGMSGLIQGLFTLEMVICTGCYVSGHELV